MFPINNKKTETHVPQQSAENLMGNSRSPVYEELRHYATSAECSDRTLGVERQLTEHKTDKDAHISKESIQMMVAQEISNHETSDETKKLKDTVSELKNQLNELQTTWRNMKVIGGGIATIIALVFGYLSIPH